MRNKILVLVLALICLFAVSALAAEVKPLLPEAAQAEFTAWYNGSTGEAAHTFHVYGGQDYYAASNKMYVVEYAAPTCIADGSVTLLCTDVACTAQHDGAWTSASGMTTGNLVVVELSKVGHTRNDEDMKDHVSATCKTSGWAVYTCDNCNTDITWYGDGSKVKDTAKHAYAKDLDKNYVAHVEDTSGSVEKSCTEYGRTLIVCKVCSKVLKDETHYADGKAEHVYVKADGTPNSVTETITYATCAQAGKTKTTVLCVNCKQVKPDAAVVYGTIAKEAHTLNTANYFTLTGTTDKNGLKYVDLAEGIDPLKSFEETVEGGTYYTLDDGTRLFKKGTLTLTYKAATCEKDGLLTLSCNVCDAKAVNVQYAVEAVEHWPWHNWDELPELDDCTEAYTVGFLCGYCKEYFTQIISAHARHEFADEPYVVIQYQNNGATKIEKYAHMDNFGGVECQWDDEIGCVVAEHYNVVLVNGVASDAKIAECLPYTEVYGCCNYIGFDRGCEVKKTVEVKATSPKHSAPVDENGNIIAKECYSFTDSTCNATGTCTYACVDCGATVTETIPQKTHEAKNNKWTVAVQPTCAAPGKATATCKHCNGPMEETLAQLKHELVYRLELSTVADGCLAGVKVYTCDNCNEVKREDIAAQHDDSGYAMKDYIAFETSTCAKAGYKTFVCNDCNKTVTVALPKLAHTYPILTEEMFSAPGFVKKATCCTPAYYTLSCTNAGCTAIKYVAIGEAEGHKDLTAKKLADIRDAVYNNDFSEYTKDKLIVNGTINCESAATGTLLCKAEYDVWTEKDGTWTKAQKKGVCTYEWSFTLPAREHMWSDVKLDKETGKYYAECEWEDCDAIKGTNEIKPEYEVTLDGTKGKVVLKSNNMSELHTAWVRISYGFELSDGSYLAMTTCMPITFDWDENGNQYGTFSFFALNTSLESTGVNIMVVDQYDAMYKTIGELVGNNYGMYIG